MAEFVPNKPIPHDEPLIDVTFGTAAPALTPGVHTFQLVVVDDLGVSSDPVIEQVTIQGKPVAVLSGPGRVALGQTFKLDGSKSNVPGGKIVKWIFTRIVRQQPPQ
ncbi:MAG TPA: hypothetical protein VF735_13460 [Pyrinomonadaceae bacterium]|jgi:hypothetical protein